MAKQLHERTATSSDVVSIVAMNKDSSIVVDRQPTDWHLFNKVVDLLRSQEPAFDGNYGPALDLAEKLLLVNSNGSCALTLFFLSGDILLHKYIFISNDYNSRRCFIVPFRPSTFGGVSRLFGPL